VPDRPFREPAGVVHRQICMETGLLAREACPEKRREVFIEGTEPSRACEKHGGARVPQDEDSSTEAGPVLPETRLCNSR
jgi:membrane carboxypeptidase/penicillin-binding protein